MFRTCLADSRVLQSQLDIPLTHILQLYLCVLPRHVKTCRSVGMKGNWFEVQT